MEEIKLLKNSLRYYFGFDTFKGEQEEIITNLLQGNDTFVLMPTGGGKSMCYQLPALMMDGTAIVVSPLIALMKNQVDSIKYISETDNVAHFINSSLSRADINQVKEHVKNGTTKLLYVAPESLSKKENQEFLKTVNISFFAIDEAHCISEWGHDFRPEYRRLKGIIERIGRKPIMALTATATDKVKIDIKRTLGIDNAREYISSFNRPNLFYAIKPKTNETDNDIVKYIKSHPGKSGIIYCLSRKEVEKLAEVLRTNDIRAAAYHAGMESADRTAIQDDFIMERIDVIVATIAFGMGIDKPDVRFVIHYDIPKSLEGYYQETGRAGRDGGEGRCIAYYRQQDLRKLEKFMTDKSPKEQEIGKQLLKEVQIYCESSVCRRKLLLFYFGEKYLHDNCCSCDNCRTKGNAIEAQEEMGRLLTVVAEIGNDYKMEHIIHLMRKERTESVVLAKHDQLALFGCGEEHTATWWKSLIVHAMVEGFLDKESENYGALHLTEKGKQFIEQPHSFKMIEDRDFVNLREEVNEEMGVLDEVIYSLLVELRKSIARRNQLPPYVIFSDQSLEAMSTYYPQTIEEIRTMYGVGDGKAKKFGQEFADLIKKYCEENDIIRPIDIRVKSLPTKSRNKVSIIQGIDRRMSFEDIARSLHIDMDGLLSDIEMIVNSGTKLNINYYLEEAVDEEHEEEIYDYFMHSETDDLDIALDNIDEEISEEEIRLVRIKFLSELGN